MTPSLLVPMVLVWMTTLAPVERFAAVQDPDVPETAEERTARYRSIAGDIAEASADDPDPKGAAALLTSIAFFESGFAPGVDRPSCGTNRVHRGGCDHGKARSIFQLRAFHGDRAEAAVEALRRIRRSLNACRRLPREHRLAAYTGGSCGRGWKESRARVALADRLQQRGAP